MQASKSLRAQPTRSFHATRTTRYPRKGPKKSVKSPEAVGAPHTSISASDIKPYTDEEKEQLARFYTPAQMAAIEAGEASIDNSELFDQATLRRDSYALSYSNDDLSKIMPVVDYPEKVPEENYDPNWRLKTREEIASDLGDFIRDLPNNSTQVDYKRFVDSMRLTVGKEAAERNPITSLAPELPKRNPALMEAVQEKNKNDEMGADLKRLMKQTGLDWETIKHFRIRTLVSHRVVNQTRMGKIPSRYVLAVAGNQKGLLGIGEGKSSEVSDATRQARYNAIRSMQPIPRYEERTIYGDVKIKMGAVELELMNRPPGMSSLFSQLLLIRQLKQRADYTV